MERRVINPWPWSQSFGFQQAVETVNATRQLVCSGQTAAAADGTLQAPGDMGAQLVIAMDNLEAVLHAAGYTLADVTRLNVYVTDIAAFFAGYGPVAERLGKAGCMTAMTLLVVAGFAFEGQVCEIEATAAR